jgi:hypothetical protein
VPVTGPAEEQPGSHIPLACRDGGLTVPPPGGSPGEQFDPFKFLIYADLAGVEIGPLDWPPAAR